MITSYQLNITATDGGSPQLSGSTMITIIVVDENDNNPIFSASTYRQNIGENAPEGSVVQILEAADADSTSNGELVYSLLEGTDVFEVDNSSGIVTVLNSSLLDYEVQRSFSFLVEVRDMGIPPRAAQALVRNKQLLNRTYMQTYCIAGKFGGGLNLVAWWSAFVTAKFKSANISYSYILYVW